MTQMDEKKKILKEVGFVYVGSILFCVFLGILRFFIPFLRNNLSFFFAVLFIYLPIIVLRRQRRSPSDYGISFDRLSKAFKWLGIVIIVVFPLYIIGNHLWQVAIVGAHLNIRPQNFLRWPAELESESVIRDDITRGKGFHLAVFQEHLILAWRDIDEKGLIIDLKVEHAGQPHSSLTDIKGFQEQPQKHFISSHTEDVLELKIFPGDSSRIIIPFLDVDQFQLSLIDFDGQKSEVPVFMGEYYLESHDNPIEYRRSIGWLLMLLLVQIVMIGLPEELFYRGYIQGRLNDYYRKNWKIGTLEIKPSIVLASILFALGHLAVVPSPERLAVFFPSLLFGWMKEKTGNIVAPLIFHGLCNVLSIILAKQYFI